MNRPIRVKADPVDGSETVRFLGYVNGWPTEWSDGTDATAYAPISASSRLARIGTQAALKSIVEEAILEDSPVAYYTLGEPAGAIQADDSSGNRADPMVMIGSGADVVFGNATGPGTDGLTAAEFTDGKSLAGSITPPAAPAGGASVEAFFLADTPTLSQIVSANEIAVLMTASGTLRAFSNPVTVDSPAGYSDGATHHAAATSDGTTLRLYVDGALVASAALGTVVVPSPSSRPAGSRPRTCSRAPSRTPRSQKKLTDAQVLAHATAGLTGYAGETTSTRLLRYAALANIRSAEVSAEAGSTTMQHVDTTDKKVVELMRVCETTEGGVLFDARDGTLTFHNRAHRYTVTSAYTLNMAEQEVEKGYAPRVDLTGLANDISARDISGQYTAHVFDQDSIDDNGFATASIETASQDDDEPRNLAAWNLLEFKDPKERVPNLEVDALAQVGKTPNCAAVLATTVGDKITVATGPLRRPARPSTTSLRAEPRPTDRSRCG